MTPDEITIAMHTAGTLPKAYKLFVGKVLGVQTLETVDDNNTTIQVLAMGTADVTDLLAALEQGSRV